MEIDLLLVETDHLLEETDQLLGETDLLPGETDHLLEETDHLPVETDHLPVETDHLPGETDHQLGATDHQPGATDHLPGETDQALGNGPAAVEPAIGHRKDKSMIFWMLAVVAQAHSRALEVRQATFYAIDRIRDDHQILALIDQARVGQGNLGIDRVLDNLGIDRVNQAVDRAPVDLEIGPAVPTLVGDLQEFQRLVFQHIEAIVTRDAPMFARISVRIPRTYQVSGQVFGPDTQIQIGDGDGPPAPM